MYLGYLFDEIKICSRWS